VEAEEEAAGWRRRCEGESAAAVEAARATAAAAVSARQAAEEDAASARRALEEARSAGSAGGLGSAGGSEASALRDRLSQLRRELSAVREEADARSGEASEARFAKEEAEAEAARWRRRSREAEAAGEMLRVGARAARSLGRDPLDIIAAGGASASESGAHQRPSLSREDDGHGSESGGRHHRRVAELEAAVGRLGRLAEGQRGEIQRLRALHGSRQQSSAQPSTPESSGADAMRVRVAELEASLAARDTSLRAARAELEAVAAGRGDEVALQAAKEEAEVALQAARAEAARLQSRVARLERRSRDTIGTEHRPTSAAETAEEAGGGSGGAGRGQEADVSAALRAAVSDAELRASRAESRVEELKAARDAAERRLGDVTRRAEAAEARSAQTRARAQTQATAVAPAPAATGTAAAAAPSEESSASARAERTVDEESGQRIAELEERIEAMRRERDALQRSNSALKEELGAFDVDFFEELEDLKWRHAQAIAKCRAMDDLLEELGRPKYDANPVNA
jgi:hypothetical protein